MLQELEEYARINHVPIMVPDGINYLTNYIKENNVKNILEIGTAIAYSAIKMCLVDDDIKVTTIERNPDMIVKAKENIKKFNMEDRITIIEGDALDVEVEFDMPREMGLSNIKKTFLSEITTSETKFHKGSLRSGQKLEEERSIVILGDVNSGAEVIASDNIVVLGTLRGLAHAGAKGNKQAIIAAGRLDTVQMRIANIVREFNREEEPLRKLAYAYVDKDKIVIE